MSSWYNASAPVRPVVIQGHPVQQHSTTYAASPYSHKQQQQQPQQPYQAQHEEDHPQPQRGCRDVFWGVLFYVHLGAMAAAAAVYAPQVIGSAVENYNSGGGGDGRRFLLSDDDHSDSYSSHLYRPLARLLQDDGGGGGNADYEDVDLSIDPAALLAITGIAGILGCLFSSMALSFMIRFAEGLIKTALIFNIVMFAIMALLSLAVGELGGVMVGGLMCALSIYYTVKVWSRIPFAASNLVTAVTAVQDNIGLVLYAYISLVLLFGWSIWWTISAASTVLVVADCDADGECQNEVSAALIFMFMVSYYWTVQVIVNVVHVTTAGTVGTWWFQPVEASGCCSKAVRDSYVRSLTTSFGSICLGSLIVALIQAVREFIHSLREDGDSIVACCAECMIGCLESLAEYFNKWAFVYVGLYGFSFMEAGTNVMTLFRNRGWTSIITDYMLDLVLFMVSVAVGALTALVALLIGAALGMGEVGTLGAATILAFILGYGMAATLFSVVSSAVNTVIVCYAEAPNEFQANHPQLSNQMRDSWRQAWPNDFGY